MPELTADIIADVALPRDLDLSPDGSRVVYALVPIGKKAEHNSSPIWVAPTDGSSPPRRFTAGTAADTSPRWSPDGRQIAFLSDRESRGTAQLFLIDADGGEARSLTPTTNKRAVERFAWSPGGGQIAFASADEPTDEDTRREKERDDAEVFGERLHYARLRLLSVATGEVTTLFAGEGHVTAIAWSPEGKEIAYQLWETPAIESIGREVRLERVAIAGATPQPVGIFPNGVSGLVWAGGSLVFIGTAQGRPQSSNAIWTIPVAGGKPRLVALSEESCAEALAPAGDRPVATVAYGLAAQIQRLNPESGALEPLSADDPEQLDDIGGVAAQSLADGRIALAGLRSTGNQPWEIWAGYASPGERLQLRQITHHQTELQGIEFGPQEPFLWSAPDGLALDGLLVRPPDAPEGPLPTFVLVHGGPYGRWEPGFNLSWGNWAQWLALAGYAVLMPNPRGGFGRGERFAAAARADVGGADNHDVMTMVDAAIERGIADPERLAIGGWSQGGFMTAWAVTQTGRFKAGIMGAGVSDWGMMVMTSDLPDFERALGGSAPWEGVGPHRHAELSPISFAANVTTPLLILHGQNDARVPLSQAIGYHRALREHGVPTELVTYPREPHSIGERNHQADILRRVRAWCDRWIRG
jgi:dipeptidyl aminopeptidase/acylaminoacyl peptidase